MGKKSLLWLKHWIKQWRSQRELNPRDGDADGRGGEACLQSGLTYMQRAIVAGQQDAVGNPSHLGFRHPYSQRVWTPSNCTWGWMRVCLFQGKGASVCFTVESQLWQIGDQHVPLRWIFTNFILAQLRQKKDRVFEWQREKKTVGMSTKKIISMPSIVQS